MAQRLQEVSVAARVRRAGRGQALVEFALMMPVMVGIFTAAFQLGILFLVYLSLMHSTRDLGRWLMTHPDQTDAQVQAYVMAHLPPNIVTTNLSFDFSAANPNDWPWSPRCPSLDANNRCASRADLTLQRLALVYDARAHIFLPSTFRLGSWQTTIPSTLPRYEYYVMVEPR